MPLGRPKKNKNMEPDQTKKLPIVNEGDSILLKLEIARVSNGYIITNSEPGTKNGIMVFNGENAHRLASSHVFDLAITDMKEGEVIVFSSQLTYTKKNPA